MLLSFATRLLAVVIARLRADGLSLIRDAIGVVSLGAVAYGVWLIYQPAGFIIGGLIGFACSLLAAPKETSGVGR